MSKKKNDICAHFQYNFSTRIILILVQSYIRKHVFKMCRHISYLSYDDLTQYCTVVFNGFFLNHIDRLKNVSTHFFPLFNSRWDKIKVWN